MRSLIIIASVPILLSGGLCAPSTESAPAAEPTTADERLRGPRNMYKGNINENLRELQEDLEETASDRNARHKKAIDEAVKR